jgi:hypothetical protein
MNEASHQFRKALDKNRAQRRRHASRHSRRERAATLFNRWTAAHSRNATETARRTPPARRAKRSNFIGEHGGKLGNLSVYGQQSNPTTWRLAAMNMAIRGIDFNFGKEPANSFTSDQHPDLRTDYVMANPPFNASTRIVRSIRPAAFG